MVIFERGVVRLRLELGGSRTKSGSAPHAPIVGLGEQTVQSLVMRAQALRVELHTQAAIGLRDDTDRHVGRVAPAVDAARIAVGRRHVDSDILRGAERGVPGAVEIRRDGRRDADRL